MTAAAAALLAPAAPLPVLADAAAAALLALLAVPAVLADVAASWLLAPHSHSFPMAPLLPMRADAAAATFLAAATLPPVLAEAAAAALLALAFHRVRCPLEAPRSEVGKMQLSPGLSLVFLSSVALQLPTPSTVAPSAIAQAAAQQRFALVDSQNAIIFPSTTAVAYIGQEPADTASRAAAMRGAATKEDAMKAARAQKALERAQKAKEGKERLAAANAAVEGLQPCPTGTFGSNTGMLSAQSCYRVRDGNIDAAKKTGAFLIF